MALLGWCLPAARVAGVCLTEASPPAPTSTNRPPRAPFRLPPPVEGLGQPIGLTSNVISTRATPERRPAARPSARSRVAWWRSWSVAAYSTVISWLVVIGALGRAGLTIRLPRARPPAQRPNHDSRALLALRARVPMRIQLDALKSLTGNRLRTIGHSPHLVLAQRCRNVKSAAPGPISATFIRARADREFIARSKVLAEPTPIASTRRADARSVSKRSASLTIAPVGLRRQVRRRAERPSAPHGRARPIRDRRVTNPLLQICAARLADRSTARMRPMDWFSYRREVRAFDNCTGQACPVRSAAIRAPTDQHCRVRSAHCAANKLALRARMV